MRVLDRNQHFPVLTIVLFATTAAFSIAQLVLPELAGWLGREPTAMAAGEYWRFVTALLVQSDGIPQMAVNLPALLIVGILVERRWSKVAWAAAYLAGGLAGEAFGLYWQPVGGGNSVAVAGLLGLLLYGLPRERSLPWPVRIVWPTVGLCAAIYLSLHTDIHGPPLVAGALVGLVATLLVRDLKKL